MNLLVKIDARHADLKDIFKENIRHYLVSLFSDFSWNLSSKKLKQINPNKYPTYDKIGVQLDKLKGKTIMK